MTVVQNTQEVKGDGDVLASPSSTALQPVFFNSLFLILKEPWECVRFLLALSFVSSSSASGGGEEESEGEGGEKREREKKRMEFLGV